MYLRSALMSISALAILTACGDSPANPAVNQTVENTASAPTANAMPDRKIISAMVAKMAELADTLETVTDEDSARAASQKIAAIGKDMEALANQVDGSSASTKMSAVMQTNSDEFGKIQGRLVSQVARLALTKPKLMEIIAEEMEKIDF